MAGEKKSRVPEGLTFEEVKTWAQAQGIAFKEVEDDFGNCGWCDHGRYVNPYNLEVIEDPRDVYSPGERIFTSASFGECYVCGGN